MRGRGSQVAGHRCKTWVEVSKAALARNASAFRAHIGRETKLMAVVKANAYGHGLIEVSKAVLPHVDWFGVDNLDEALALKRKGVRKPVLTLGFTPSWRMPEAARNGFRVTVGSMEQLKAAATGAKKAKRRLKVHLKAETGTTRQGFEGRALPDAAGMIAKSKFLAFEGLSTHYANIEDTADHSYAAGQLGRFQKAADLLEAHGYRPEIRHTACSAAAALYPDTHFDLVRLGISLYGIWSSKETREGAAERGADLPLVPALAWKTRIAQIKEVRSGTPVSYGLTERMPRNGRVAVLGAGYWDGLDRGLSSVGEVLVRGTRCKILGRVCMNMTMIDVTAVPDARPEEEAVLIGESGGERVAAEEMAEKLGTIPYEVLARINPTLPRVLK